MKKWNTPEVAELNVTETANGIFDLDWESPLDFFSKKSSVTTNPEEPEEDSEETDKLS